MTRTASSCARIAPASGKQSPYFLRRDVYLAEIGRKAIFLDLNSDKYRAVDRVSFQALAPYLSGQEGAPGPAKLLQALLEQRLLTTEKLIGKPIQQITHRAAVEHVTADGKSPGALLRAALLCELFHT